MTIEKIKILGAVLELPARQHCQSSLFTKKWAELAVLVAPKRLTEVCFFKCHGWQIFILAEIHCYLSLLKSWLNNSFLSVVISHHFKESHHFHYKVIVGWAELSCTSKDLKDEREILRTETKTRGLFINEENVIENDLQEYQFLKVQEVSCDTLHS